MKKPKEVESARTAIQRLMNCMNGLLIEQDKWLFYEYGFPSDVCILGFSFFFFFLSIEEKWMVLFLEQTKTKWKKKRKKCTVCVFLVRVYVIWICVHINVGRMKLSFCCFFLCISVVANKKQKTNKKKL